LTAEINNGNDIDICGGESTTLTVSTTGASDCSDCCTRPVYDTNHCDGEADYIFWLSDGKDNKRWKNVSVVWKECADGTASLRGEGVASDGEIVVIDVMYSGFTSNAPAGSPKDPNCNGASTSNYDYYTILTGTAKVGGTTYDLSRRGPAFQIGTGANVTHTTTDYGGSGLFDASGNGRWTIGDFNIQLGNKQCSNGDITYLWDGPGGLYETTESVVATETGTYSVTVTDCNGCSVEDNIELNVSDPSSTGINCPADVSISCEDSTEPEQTGFATGDAECGEATITYADELTGTCPQVLVRTWTSTVTEEGSNECIPALMAKWHFDNVEQGCLNGIQPLDAGVTVTDLHINGCSNFSVSKVTGADHGSSCVQGSGGSAEAAICIQDQDDVAWKDNDDDAAHFEINFGAGDEGAFTTFCLKERATTQNENFGHNEPPSKFGVRVTKNGTEIFQEIDIPTTAHWSSHCFDINDTYNGATTYRVEILG